MLRVDGEPVPTGEWPRLDRFREHSIDLPVGEAEVTPGREPELAELIRRALDLLAEADGLVDLGPEVGHGGGRIVAERPPAALAEGQDTHAARALRRHLGHRG